MYFSIICSNVYPGKPPIEFMLRNLAAQTFRDFEVIIVDAFYRANKILVEELAESLGLAIVHTPACEQRHAGSRLHWELLNNGLLLANSEWLLFHGVHRYLHHQALAVIADKAAENIPIVLMQCRAEDTIESLPANVEEVLGLHVDTQPYGYLSQSGFFSIKKSDMLLMNGWNEALTLHHWIDCDLSQRAKKLPLKVRILGCALLRLERSGHYGLNAVESDQISGIGKSPCDRLVNPDCLMSLITQPLVNNRVQSSTVQRFTHDGYEWIRCSKCGQIGIEHPDSYMAFLDARPVIKAPINVYGVGRNIVRLAEDLSTMPLASKVYAMAASHNNPRYLEV